MNILILNWKDIEHPQVGGAEIIVYELAKRLVKKGHEVTWFCRSFEGGKKKETIEGIKIVRRGNIITMYLLALIYYWLLETKPDVVIDMSNTIFWQTPLWAWQSKKLAYLNQLGQEVFFWEYFLPIAILGYVVERLQYLTYLVTSFAVYSSSTRDDIGRFGIPKKNISVFRLGIDHTRYVPGKKSKTPLFICVSRLVKMKRTDLAIRAMPLVIKSHPETNLVIMGSGYDRGRLENLRDKLGLKNSVYFLDKDTWFFEKNVKDKKVTMMQAAWALIFPSVKEGWGMTVTECAACGTPTIATDVTGLRDSVVSGKTGILLSRNPDPEELAKAMIKLIENSDKRKKMSQEAIKYAKNFSWEKSIVEFEAILKKLIHA